MDVHKTKTTGFTLLELLVVIAIIGVLSAVVVASLGAARDRGRVAAGQKFDQSAMHSIGAYVVGIWDFEEGTGTAANDRSGHGHDGTIAGATYVVNETLSGNALSFDGSDYVRIPNFDNGVMRQNQESASWTLSIWAKETVANANEHILIGRQGCNGGIYTWNGGYAFAVKAQGASCWTGAQAITHTPPDMGEWHHLAGVYDNRSMKFYVDGALVGEATFSATMYNYSTTFGVGSGGSASYMFNGELDQARVYKSALTAQAIRNLYVQGAPRYVFAQE